MEAFFQSIQKACLPGAWSKGVSLARENAVWIESKTPAEIIARIKVSQKPVQPRVTLWIEDEDYYCDCGEKADPCAHVAAAVIALKTPGLSAPKEDSAAQRKPAIAHLEYRFTGTDHSLQLERWIQRPGQEPELLRTSLTSLAGGIQSGRIPGPPLSLTQEEFLLDRVLSSTPWNQLPFESVQYAFSQLESLTSLTWNGQAIKVRAKAERRKYFLREDRKSLILEAAPMSDAERLIHPWMILKGEILSPLLPLPSNLEKHLPQPGASVSLSPSQIPFFSLEILPPLKRVAEVEHLSGNLPEVSAAKPWIQIQTVPLENQGLSATAVLMYGNPPVAEVRSGRLEGVKPQVIIQRDYDSEKQWIRRLQTELHLSLEQPKRFQGEEAVRFLRLLKDWGNTGESLKGFDIAGDFEPVFQWNEGSFDLQWKLSSASADLKELPGFQAIQDAWKSGRSLVSLGEQGWARIPTAWMEKNSTWIQSLLESRDSHGKLPKAQWIAIASHFEEEGAELPESLLQFQQKLLKHEGIPDSPLPENLAAQLRPYQKAGYDWLSYLREQDLGALLADEMGLGKTLQALCAARGRTLIVCPTSVLPGWKSQLEQFLPGSRVHLFHGSARVWDPQADFTLTSYGLLRTEADLLEGEHWDTIILDESQVIKNPLSQTARSAFALKGRFKIALSGTPIENRAEDLWSVMHFLNPGVLGTLRSFSQRADGQASWVKRRVRPFYLRREKGEVATDLPPKTEMLLEVELSEEERIHYDTVMAATQTEVLRVLESSGNILGALEALLRLRQACVHPALLPHLKGQAGIRSSKVELLMEKLEEIQDSGKRALVFSQWTSLLDLLEPELQARGISFLRLDGSTTDRKGVVETFQKADGPTVLILSLKAGGVGLTLTAADHVFVMDPWWNPAVEDQATDRAHRIGQDKPVFVYRLVAQKTVEEKILALQTRKRELVKAILDEGQAALHLTRDDLLSLFSN